MYLCEAAILDGPIAYFVVLALFQVKIIGIDILLMILVAVARIPLVTNRYPLEYNSEAGCYFVSFELNGAAITICPSIFAPVPAFLCAQLSRRITMR